MLDCELRKNCCAVAMFLFHLNLLEHNLSWVLGFLGSWVQSLGIFMREFKHRLSRYKRQASSVKVANQMSASAGEVSRVFTFGVFGLVQG